jgi:hypothetical protein
MEDKLIQFLKSFKSIQPDAGFTARTRHLLLTSAGVGSAVKSFKKGFFEDVVFGSALVLASVVAIFSLAGFATFSASGGVRADLKNLNETAIRSEAQTIDFSIHLGEAMYFEESAKEVAVLLREISGDAVAGAGEAN